MGFQYAIERGQRMVRNEIEDQVVPLPGQGEVLYGVVDDVVRADRTDQVNISGARHARHLGAKSSGGLDSDRAHASGGAIDQDSITLLEAAPVTKRLERGATGKRYSCRLPDREPVALVQARAFIDAYVLSKGAIAPAEYLIAGLNVSHVLANRFNVPCHVGPEKT